MADGETSKRKLPPALVQLLDQDKKLTKWCFDAFDKKYGAETHRRTFKHLEISCHGLVWIGGTLAMLYLAPSYISLWVNLLAVLLLDIAIVGVVKAFSRRRRPAYNRQDMFATVSIDKFSFPSGHATRAVAMALFFAFLYPLPLVLVPVLFTWSVTVCASRVLLGRHHVLDVAGGVAIGFAEYLIMKLLWVSDESAKDFGAFLFGEDPWSAA